jgi:hypothetical protein
MFYAFATFHSFAIFREQKLFLYSTLSLHTKMLGHLIDIPAVFVFTYLLLFTVKTYFPFLSNMF